jgi:hypothetical protein
VGGGGESNKILFSNLQLVHANSAAKKRFNLANSDELCDLAERIELKQVISVEDD